MNFLKLNHQTNKVNLQFKFEFIHIYLNANNNNRISNVLSKFFIWYYTQNL
jgi:hypothetical protein